MNDKTFVERIADIIQVNANAKQVYGEPVERDGTTIIPVARVQWGFGGGGLGRGAAERGGGGGGARATAIGYIELRRQVGVPPDPRQRRRHRAGGGGRRRHPRRSHRVPAGAI